MSDRRLASVRTIDKIVPHKNADRLEVAILGGWPAVVAKGQFKEGDPVVFCEVDSLLPPRPEYDFLEKSCSHTEPDGTKWYRIKTVRLRKQLSQGLVLPIDIVGPPDVHVGQDVTAELGVRKYEKPVPPQLAGVARGSFPSFIPKTDEERIQNLEIFNVAGWPFVKTEKLDGSSCTAYRQGERIGVCSRNLELVENPNNAFWKAARECKVFDALNVEGEIAIQGEVCGPGIQGNRYKLDRPTFFAFNVFDIEGQRYLPKRDVYTLCHVHNIPTVPYLGIENCPDTIDEVLADAEATSLLNPSVQREGVVWDYCDTHVFRNTGKISFKAISNKFLLEKGE